MTESAVPVPAVPSATVVPIRERAGAIEVALLQRNGRLGYHGGSWVFPGGRIDADDAGEGDTDRARSAAVREAEEEVGLELSPDDCRLYAHWTTPLKRKRRFSTHFFLAWADGPLRPDTGEIVDAVWTRPGDALAKRDAGEIVLPPPTFVTLWRLHREGAALFETAVERILPRPYPLAGGVVSLYPGDHAYETGFSSEEAAGLPRHRVWLMDRGWRYERAFPRVPSGSP